jgi:hypothetical protein
MRTKLAVAGLVAGLGATLAPLSPATAYCEPEIIVVEGQEGGCRNSCIETGQRYEELREKSGSKLLPSYWALFACPM